MDEELRDLAELYADTWKDETVSAKLDYIHDLVRSGLRPALALGLITLITRN